jgi:hypothetical protein
MLAGELASRPVSASSGEVTVTGGDDSRKPGPWGAPRPCSRRHPGPRKNKRGFRCGGPGRGAESPGQRGQDEGARRGSAWCSPLLRVELSPAGREAGASLEPQAALTRVSWDGEVAGARERGLEGSRRCSRMAWAVVDNGRGCPWEPGRVRPRGGGRPPEAGRGASGRWESRPSGKADSSSSDRGAPAP